MSVLSIDQVIELSIQIGQRNPLEMDERNVKETMKLVEKLADVLEADADHAEEIIKSSISEEKCVNLFKTVQNHVLANMTSNGRGFSLLDSHVNGELSEYTDTLALTVIGILFREGVL